MDQPLHPQQILSGQRCLASIGGSLVEVETDFTRDGRVWLCRDRIGQFFPVNAADLRPLLPSAKCTSEAARRPFLSEPGNAASEL